MYRYVYVYVCYLISQNLILQKTLENPWNKNKFKKEKKEKTDIAYVTHDTAYIVRCYMAHDVMYHMYGVMS